MNTECDPQRIETLQAKVQNLEDYLATLKYFSRVASADRLDEADPGRTVLTANLAHHLRKALRADVSFVAYREVLADDDGSLRVDQSSFDADPQHFECALYERLNSMQWSFPPNEWRIVEAEQPVLLYDTGLEQLPPSLQGVVTAVAACKVQLSGREYLLFFCDITQRHGNEPRYSGNHSAMIYVAIGILGAGFRAGLRSSRQARYLLEREIVEKTIQRRALVQLQSALTVVLGVAGLATVAIALSPTTSFSPILTLLMLMFAAVVILAATGTFTPRTTESILLGILDVLKAPSRLLQSVMPTASEDNTESGTVERDVAE